MAAKMGSKTDFVRGFPDLAAADVVKKGAEAGLKFSDKYVYKVRAVDRSKTKKGAAAKGKKAPKAAARSAAPAAKQGSTSASDFVKALPPTTSFKEAAKKATELGIKLSKGYFYVLKSGAKKGTATKGKPGRRPKVAAAGGNALRLSSSHPSEQALIEVVRKIGVGRARDLLASIEKFERG